MGWKLKVIRFNCGFNGPLVWLYSGAIARSGLDEIFTSLSPKWKFKGKAWDLQIAVVFSASSIKGRVHKSVNSFSHRTPIPCLADSRWLWLNCTNSVRVKCLLAGVWDVLVLRAAAHIAEFSKKISPWFSLRIVSYLFSVTKLIA